MMGVDKQMVNKVGEEALKKIKVTRTKNSRIGEIDFNNLIFGKQYADHMLVADFDGKEWKNAEILPFGHLSVSPSNAAWHYGQAIFEGIKAYKDQEGMPMIFRPYDNYARFNNSAERMGMPEVPEWLFIGGMELLIDLDRDWVPTNDGCSLYLRPFMIAADEFIGVRPSDTYKFVIINSPSGPYFNKPIKLLVQDKYIRAFPGGVGAAKAAGNYGGVMYPTMQARKQGYDQILWVDGLEFKYLQECGTMNVFAIIGNTAITPDLNQGTILAGVTRAAVMSVLEDMGLKVEERPVSIEELVEAYQAGTLREVFGTGTAASVAYVQELDYKEHRIRLDPTKYEVGNELLERLDAIRTGKAEDTHHWNYKVGTYSK
ncbi:branched-chain amino acid aminotransferase [Chitinophaga sancti]|uniref:Branched-chain-amino-acid aminotransferase n=1 Tax=Chitinophaga sancti TaxID=1004 RepID=A0A1K1QBB2_9BACT|nr:branched-chain amino acid aminotransferase [Chitinophaga sancti]WQD61265.1 branched-chain amino acid aminotransferase [Chitinophaga sancti]WQG86608.1 branched-chain amino acid aminotransferase [Chitinophaga sancti]SFW56486.1 branched-chain amino acid aminotransferase [Chitinophaga sancti]